MTHSNTPSAALTVEVFPWGESQDDIDASMQDIVLDALEWQGCDLTDVRARAGDAGAMTTLAFESHKRGRNWLALLKGKNAANMDRDFLKLSGRLVDYQSIEVGDPFEVGADYYTGSGNPHRCRHYGVAIETGDDRFVFAVLDTAAKAMKLARTRRMNIEKLEKAAA